MLKIHFHKCVKLRSLFHWSLSLCYTVHYISCSHSYVILSIISSHCMIVELSSNVLKQRRESEARVASMQVTIATSVLKSRVKSNMDHTVTACRSRE